MHGRPFSCRARIGWLARAGVLGWLCFAAGCGEPVAPDSVAASPVLARLTLETALPSWTESSVELLSLDAQRGWKGEAHGFHGWYVLGAAEIGDAAKERRLWSELRAAVDNSPDAGEAACFDPHHGLRIRRRSHITDYVICFLCQKVQVYTDGQYAGYFLLLPECGKQYFNAELTRLGLPIAIQGPGETPSNWDQTSAGAAYTAPLADSAPAR